MNAQILKTYNIHFQKGLTGNKFTDGKSVLSSYLVAWSAPGDIDDYIVDIDLCLNGQISDIAEPYYDDFLNEIYGKLTADTLILSDINGTNRTSVPLIDFKEILLSWKEFLAQ